MENQNNNSENDKKPGKFNFNSYWIYGIIILLLIGFNLMYFPEMAVEKINISDYERMVENGSVAKLEVVNQKDARVYLKPERIKDSQNKTSSM